MSLKLLVSKELGKPKVMLMLLLLNKNIINSLKMRRTKLELPDGFKNLEVSFTTHQLLTNMDFINHLPKAKKRKNPQLFHILHHNHTNKRKNHLRVY